MSVGFNIHLTLTLDVAKTSGNFKYNVDPLGSQCLS